jgi:squalene synthase HpnC
MDRPNAAQESFAAQLAQYGPDAPPFKGDLAAARDYCRGLARTHYENFAVTSWLLPRELRPHFHAVYAYCRWSDDLADEITDPARSRELLDWWEHELSSCLSVPPTHPVFLALAETIRAYEIPLAPFQDLLTAFRQDTTRIRYTAINELREYCRYSADPVGRIVLHLYRAWSPERAVLSDAICTGLQWVNFCQDVSHDWHERGRIYLPRESWNRCGIESEDEIVALICQTGKPELRDSMRQLVLSETARAKAWLLEGRPLVAELPWSLGRNLDLIVQGGLAICAKIEAVAGEVLSSRPRVGKVDQAILLTRTWWQWRGGHRPSFANLATPKRVSATLLAVPSSEVPR